MSVFDTLLTCACLCLQALIAQGRGDEVIAGTHALALNNYHKKQCKEDAKKVAHDTAGKFQHTAQTAQAMGATPQVPQHTLPAVYLVPILSAVATHQQMPPQPAMQQPDLPQQQNGDQRKAKSQRWREGQRSKRALQGQATLQPAKKVC